jgi:hypothetical protein
LDPRWEGRESGAEAEGGSGFGFGGFFFAIFWCGGGFQGAEQSRGDGGYFVDGGLECRFVGFGRRVEAGDFSYELEGGGADFSWGYWGIEVEERFDVAAHGFGLRIYFILGEEI